MVATPGIGRLPRSAALLKYGVVLGALVIAPAARAQPINNTLPQLPDVTIYGTRAPFTDQAGSPEQFIDHEQILNSGALDLAQLLRHQGGLSVSSYGPLGAMAIASLRGSSGDGVLVLLDGVKLNSAENGAVDLSKVSLLGIDHIEILPGGASSRYGAGAVGGVVNLISSTKRRAMVETSIGSLGTASLQTEIGAAIGNTQVTLGLAKENADNAFPYSYRGSPFMRVNAKADEFNAVWGSNSVFGRDIIETHAALSNQALGVPGPENYPSPSASQRDFLLSGLVKWAHLWDFWDLAQDTTLSERRTTTAFENPASLYAKQSASTLDYSECQTKVEWSNDFQLLDVGAELQRDGLSGGYDGSQERLSSAFFLHDAWRPVGALSIFGDARLDWVSPFGLNPSPRVGLSYRLSPNQQLRVTWGRSFRVPSFNDLYWPTTSVSSGNPHLLPETTNQYEAGWDAYFAPCKLQTTAFYNAGQNTIQWIPGLSGAWSPRNLGATLSRGIESKLSLKLAAALLLEMSGTWLQAIDLSRGNSYEKQLMYRPDWVAHGLLRATPFKPLEMDLMWDYLGTRYTTTQNTDALPPVGLWSLRCIYGVTTNTKMILGIENLAAADYQLQPYYPMPGRTASLSLTHVF